MLIMDSFISANSLFIAGEMTGLPPAIINLGLFAYALIFLIVIVTGFTIWISKCYNTSIKLAILLAILSQTWYFIYFYIMIGDDSTAEDIINTFTKFVYMIMLIAAILTYGFYRQLTGKCALLGN